MKVVTTDMSLKLGVKIKELGRVAGIGEVLDVSEPRYRVLSGDNRFKAVFVIKEQLMENKNQEIDAVKLYNEAIEENVDEITDVAEEIVEEKPKRKSTKKKEVVEEDGSEE